MIFFEITILNPVVTASQVFLSLKNLWYLLNGEDRRHSSRMASPWWQLMILVI